LGRSLEVIRRHLRRGAFCNADREKKKREEGDMGGRCERLKGRKSLRAEGMSYYYTTMRDVSRD